MPKTRFIRKPTHYELKPESEFVIEAEVEITYDELIRFENSPLDEYDFISKHRGFMHVDMNEVWHCIFIHSKDKDYGYLVNSEGFKYARYVSYIKKSEINNL